MSFFRTVTCFPSLSTKSKTVNPEEYQGSRGEGWHINKHSLETYKNVFVSPTSQPTPDLGRRALHYKIYKTSNIGEMP